MITHIEGRLTQKNPTDVVIDCNGVGYLLNISLHTYSQIPDQENLKLYTHFQVREDAHTLYGFATLQERELFRLLISVNGVGASTARTMLSYLSPEAIRQAIASENVTVIKSVKGIGLKTAQRVIIDLKDKIMKVYQMDETSVIGGNTNRDEALSALEVLGYPRRQSERVVDKILIEHADASVELIIKEALNNL